MMKSNLIKIQFCFPPIFDSIKNKQEFARLLLNYLQKNRSIKYTGYLKSEDLYDSLWKIVGNIDINKYKRPDATQRSQIEKVIYSTIQKCYKELPLPSQPLFVFVFPWFPGKHSDAFEGIMGIAPYYTTFHLFIATNKFSKTALVNATAHELNHTVFHYYHYQNLEKYTLLDYLVFEGLAENFREEAVGGQSPPWAVALTRKEARNIFQSLQPHLGSKSLRLYKEIFFGSKKYKRWTGYSTGYWLIKDFRKRHPKLSWQEIMQMKTEDILGLTV